MMSKRHVVDEPSILARLVIAYHERFERHVPEAALRRVEAGLLAAIVQESLATGVPITFMHKYSVYARVRP
jgi:hypothetical protein